MKLAEEMVRCKTQAEVIRVVDVEARLILREWKRKLIEEALEHLVEEHYGPRWQRECDGPCFRTVLRPRTSRPITPYTKYTRTTFCAFAS